MTHPVGLRPRRLQRPLIRGVFRSALNSHTSSAVRDELHLDR